MNVQLMYQCWTFRFLYIKEEQILFYLSHLHFEYPQPNLIVTGMTNSFLLNEIKVMAWFWVTSQAQEAYLGQSHWLHNSLQWQDKNKETCHLDTLLPPWKLHLSVTSSIGTVLLMKGHLVHFSLGLHQHKPWYHPVQPGCNWGIVDIFLLVCFCSCLTK